MRDDHPLPLIFNENATSSLQPWNINSNSCCFPLSEFHVPLLSIITIYSFSFSALHVLFLYYYTFLSLPRQFVFLSLSITMFLSFTISCSFTSWCMEIIISVFRTSCGQGCTWNDSRDANEKLSLREQFTAVRLGYYTHKKKSQINTYTNIHTNIHTHSDATTQKNKTRTMKNK